MFFVIVGLTFFDFLSGLLDRLLVSSNGFLEIWRCAGNEGPTATARRFDGFPLFSDINRLQVSWLLSLIEFTRPAWQGVSAMSLDLEAVRIRIFGNLLTLEIFD